MLNLRELPQRWLIIGIAALMLLALAILAKVLGNTNDLGERMGLLMLDRALDNQTLRVQLIAETYAWDLDEQAEQQLESPANSDSLLLRRWLPLLHNRYAIQAIGLADDQGNARILERADSSWRFTSVQRNGLQSTSSIAQWPVGSSARPAGDTVAMGIDPRTEAWFSKSRKNNLFR